VGLYYQGNLVVEWTGSGPDPKTGVSPLPVLDLKGVEDSSSQITSPQDGEGIYGPIQVVIRPQVDQWDLQWAPKDGDWTLLSATNRGDHWTASWDTSSLKTGDYQLRLLSGQTSLQTVTVHVEAPQYSQ